MPLPLSCHVKSMCIRLIWFMRRACLEYSFTGPLEMRAGNLGFKALGSVKRLEETPIVTGAI